MATLAPSTQSTDQQRQAMGFALCPITGDAGTAALATAQRFGAFVAGDSIVVSSTAAFHLLAGDSSVTVTTAGPRFPAGVYKFVIPDGCTHVSMLDTSAGAGNGQAYKG